MSCASLPCLVASSQVERCLPEGTGRCCNLGGGCCLPACLLKTLRYCCCSVCFHTWLSSCKYPSLLIIRILSHCLLFCCHCHRGCIWADGACRTFGEPFALSGSAPACSSACCSVLGQRSFQPWQRAAGSEEEVPLGRRPLVLGTKGKEIQCELIGVGVN